MEVEYVGNSGVFKVPKYHASAGGTGWKDILSWVKPGGAVYFAKNRNGNYTFGQVARVDYISPTGDYIVYYVNTPMEICPEILSPTFDCVAASPQALLDEMENRMKEIRGDSHVERTD